MQMVREWMARHPFDMQAPTFDENDLYVLVADASVRAYDMGQKAGVPARRAFIAAEAPKQWQAAREELAREKSYGCSSPTTLVEVAHRAVKIAEALADALGLKD